MSATVFIYSAGPKIGTSTYCPSCYADCAKRAAVDPSGNFQIKSLSSDLIFRVLVVAKGFKPTFLDQVDPANGEASVRLNPLEYGDVPPDHVLHGRIVDSSGTPIVGAVAEAFGMFTADGKGQWGGLEAVDPLAVSDEHGEFVISAQKVFSRMDLKLSARGFANQTVFHLESGKKPQRLVMTEGATLSGRVVSQGRPQPNVSVGVVSVNRDMEHDAGHFEIATDSMGNFTFFNLPPNVDYYAYGLMDSVGAQGAIAIQPVHVGPDRQMTKMSDLPIARGYHVSGRVVLADGEAIPAHTRLLLDRQNAWDSSTVELGPDGQFDLHGVPLETIGLSVSVRGYHISEKNRSFDQLNGDGLIGQVDQDITGLKVLMEKGRAVRPDNSKSRTEAEWNALPNDHPLRAAEGRLED